MRTLVLNSTQPKRLAGDDLWVRQTILAVDQAARNGQTLVASVGTAAWELVLWRAAVSRAAVEVICPLPRHGDEAAAREQVAHEFGLEGSLATWTFLRSRQAGGRCKDTWAARDELAFHRADIVVPVSIRRGGRWDGWLRAEQTGRVDTTWSTPWVRGHAFERWEGLRFEGWAPGFDASEGALIHFTRGCSGPWPGERRCDFFDAVARSGHDDPRGAWHTLERILTEATIRGSSMRIRDGARAVCFTAMPLPQTPSLFRWRRRYARPSFEPFGLAIAMSAARRLGARPVLYDRGAGKGDFDAPGLWCQGTGDTGAWLHEQEWRMAGDLDLRQLAQHEAAVLVPSAAHASEARRLCPFPVVVPAGVVGDKGLAGSSNS